MQQSEVINLIVSGISVVIAVIALWQTKRQISLSNRQQLFDRRLDKYFEITTLKRLLDENIVFLKNDDSFLHTNDLIFLWLTNCSELEEMEHAVFEPLQNDKQKQLLVIHEHLKKSAIEIKMIFSGNMGRTLSEFVNVYADLLKAMYQLQVFISETKKNNEENNFVPTIEQYEDGCKKTANSTGVFNNRDKILSLNSRIDSNHYLDKLEKELRLVR